MSVWVSYVETPSEFYIQFKDNEDDLQAMSLQLNEALRDRREMKKSDIKEGMWWMHTPLPSSSTLPVLVITVLVLSL